MAHGPPKRNRIVKLLKAIRQLLRDTMHQFVGGKSKPEIKKGIKRYITVKNTDGKLLASIDMTTGMAVMRGNIRVHCDDYEELFEDTGEEIKHIGNDH